MSWNGNSIALLLSPLLLPSPIFRFSTMFFLGILLLLPAALAATDSGSLTSASGYSTKVYNVSAATTTLTYEYSNEELAMLWNQVGAIKSGPITTTVSPTPEPSSYPRPGAFHPLVNNLPRSQSSQN